MTPPSWLKLFSRPITYPRKEPHSTSYLRTTCTLTMAETNTDLASAAKNLSGLYRNAGKTTSATAEDHINSGKGFVSGMARPLLQQMGLTGIATKDPVVVLDLACGSGVVTQELQKALPVEVLEKSRFVAGDSSEALVAIVEKTAEGEGWRNVEARVTDAMVRRPSSHPPRPQR